MIASRSDRTRHRRVAVVGVVAALAIGALVPFAAALVTNSIGGTFDTANGSLTSTVTHDWNPAGSPTGNIGPVQEITCPTTAPGSDTNCALDLVGSGDDNALGKGTKEDTTDVTVVDGTIPPNKDDLSRFYINQETNPDNGHNLLALAWERSNLLGSAHMDFELNKNDPGITATSTGAVTLNRTEGDVLIDFDFGGSGTPVLSYRTWLTANNGHTADDCDSANSLPCWSDGTVLASDTAIASVNGAAVRDYNAPVPASPGYNTLNGTTTVQQNKTTIQSTFGEAEIDLQKAGILPENECEHLGYAWLKSRSSGSSFVSELKDIIAPMPVDISNCGTIKIIKHTDGRGIDKDFTFTTDVPSTGDTAADFQHPLDSNDRFTLNDDGNTTGDTLCTDSNTTCNVETISNVQPGDYTVTEDTTTGWSLESLTCDPSDTSGSSYGTQDGTVDEQANITVAAGETVTCTYVNKPNLGAITITKSAKDKNCADENSTIENGVCTGASTANLAGATFDISTDADGQDVVATATTGDDGTACVDGLSFDGTTTYYATETGAPSGYAISDQDPNTDGDQFTRSVDVTADATCATDTDPATGTSATVTFLDTPLTDVDVTATAQDPGATESIISCVEGTDGPSVGDSGEYTDPAEASATDLPPGTYTCTITIDP